MDGESIWSAHDKLRVQFCIISAIDHQNVHINQQKQQKPSRMCIIEEIPKLVFYQKKNPLPIQFF